MNKWLLEENKNKQQKNLKEITNKMILKYQECHLAKCQDSLNLFMLESLFLSLEPSSIMDLVNLMIKNKRKQRKKNHQKKNETIVFIYTYFYYFFNQFKIT